LAPVSGSRHPWDGLSRCRDESGVLAILDAAETLTDLLIPPGNRLEKLAGDRGGQYSIQINQQSPICFSWSGAGPEDVEIADHH
jgi:toxin HigB-1